MKKEYQLDICLKESLWKEIFSESYRIMLWEQFVQNTTPKEQWFKNHLEGFVTQLKLNSHAVTKKPLEKFSIYVVSYGMNTGSEINWDRPSIVYKASDNTLGEDVTVIPLTSALHQKQSDKFDVSVPKDDANNLFQNSWARLRQVRSVSLKRLWKAVGKITNPEVITAIDNEMKIMLGLEQATINS